MPLDSQLIKPLIENHLLKNSELPWIEFKRNLAIPQEIGEYISALSNSAALFNQAHGYMIWGIDNETNGVVGTAFNPFMEKVGNQDLDLWLSTQLDPHVQFNFHKTAMQNKDIILIRNKRGILQPGEV